MVDDTCEGDELMVPYLCINVRSVSICFERKGDYYKKHQT